MPQDLYRRLQKQLDQYSIGFPETDSGIEIDILKYLFSEADADLFLQMTQKLEFPEEVAQRVGRPVSVVADHLEDMAGRGLLFRLEREGRARFGAIPFVHGIFEFQVKDLTHYEPEKQYDRDGVHLYRHHRCDRGDAG